MNTLNKIKLHKPNVQAISTIGDFYSGEVYTFCENCENNIEKNYWYDEDCGTRDTNWFISGLTKDTGKVCVA